MNARDTVSDICTVSSLIAALTARQQEIEWALRSGASAVAIVAGLVAIWLRLFPRNENRAPERKPMD